MCVSYRRPLAIAKSASPFEFPPKDVAEMLQDKKLAIVDTPVDNCVVFIDMNVKTPRLTSKSVASGRLCDIVSKNHVGGDVRPRRADAREPRRDHLAGLAAAEAPCHRDAHPPARELFSTSSSDRYWRRCPTVSSKPVAMSRAHSSRSNTTRRRSARRLTRAVPTGGTSISIYLMPGFE